MLLAAFAGGTGPGCQPECSMLMATAGVALALKFLESNWRPAEALFSFWPLRDYVGRAVVPNAE